MEIRSNYATNSSSASFILELRFETVDGKHAAMHLAVSRGICYSVDGDMQGDVIYLYPKQEDDDIVVGKRSIYSVTALDDLCDLLFDAATIEGWQDPMAEYNEYRAKVNGLLFAVDGKLKCYDSHKELAGHILERVCHRCDRQNRNVSGYSFLWRNLIRKSGDGIHRAIGMKRCE